MNVEPTPESQVEIKASRRENTLLASEEKKYSLTRSRPPFLLKKRIFTLKMLF